MLGRFHGLPRLTAALSEFGFPSTQDQRDQFAESNRIWQIGLPPFRIDVLTSIDGVSFPDAWRDKAAGDLAGTPVHCLSREHYLLNKRSTTRTKDKQDADRLEELGTD